MENITTTSGETFTYKQHTEMAHLVYVRFGRNFEAATAAWRRLMQNSTTTSEFKTLTLDYVLNKNRL